MINNLEDYFEAVIDELNSRGLELQEAIDLVSIWGGKGLIEKGFENNEDVNDLINELI